MIFKNFLLWPGMSAVSIYRMSHRLNKGGRIKKIAGHFLYRLNIALNGADITQIAKIGDNFQLVHSVGVVIGECLIGNNVRVFQNVTLGKREAGPNDDFPTIGDNVTIYAGAVIIGPCKIGNGAKIGANSVVMQDVPDNCVAVGVPARLLN